MKNLGMVAGAWVVSLAVVACGSSSDSGGGATCGAGTVASADGTCVAQCGVGTTLVNGQCVGVMGAGGTGGAGATGGSGVGAGGTTAAAGTGGQPAGGTSGVGGTAQSGASGAGAQGGSGAGAVGGMSTAGAAGTPSTGGMGQAGSGPTVPCPAHIDLNCDAACGAVDSRCNTTPPGDCVGFIYLTTTPPTPFIIRLPENPGIVPACAKHCSASQHDLRALELGISQPATGTDWWRARSDTPDWTPYPQDDKKYACPTSFVTTCAAVQPSALIPSGKNGDLSLFITTINPNAPATTITIEHAPTELSCP